MDSAGSKMLFIMNWFPKAVKSKGAVSPMILATDNAMPVIIPLFAVDTRM